jgi:hypothetical protein
VVAGGHRGVGALKRRLEEFPTVAGNLRQKLQSI